MQRLINAGLILLAPLIFALAFGPGMLDSVLGARAATGPCRITRVIDGDTVAYQCAPEVGYFGRGRLLAIDAPELNGECFWERVVAQRAKWALRGFLWRADRVALEVGESKDRFGRRLVKITAHGMLAADFLIGKGLATRYPGRTSPKWCAE